VAIFFQHSINDNTKLGIWRIEEQEDFFLGYVPLKREVSHPYKRLQHLAGRYLLPVLFDNFPLEEIKVADTRKPFLHDEKYHFSISHCGNYAAAIASDTSRVGIDIELITPRLLGIQQKFLNEEEFAHIEAWKDFPKIYLELVTMLWSAKEAIYKWYGDGKLNFKEDMRLQGSIIYEPDNWITMSFLFSKMNITQELMVNAKTMSGLVLAYVVS
jgi:4'-phosphopantetheinyl transferase EntD